MICRHLSSAKAPMWSPLPRPVAVCRFQARVRQWPAIAKRGAGGGGGLLHWLLPCCGTRDAWQQTDEYLVVSTFRWWGMGVRHGGERLGALNAEYPGHGLRRSTVWTRHAARAACSSRGSGRAPGARWQCSNSPNSAHYHCGDTTHGNVRRFPFGLLRQSRSTGSGRARRKRLIRPIRRTGPVRGLDPVVIRRPGR